MNKIQMVDLRSQYDQLKPELDKAINDVLESTAFIMGPQVKEFEKNLASYHGVKHAIGCANGTDALQLIMMAMGYKTGDEVIIPSFTYVATAEVIALLNLKPVLVDVDPQTFNIDVSLAAKNINKNTVGIVPVHLFGQSAELEDLIKICESDNIHLIEDNAQSIGATFQFKNGQKKLTGTIGDAGAFSFFPSKNLGCYGDGGAVLTDNDDLARKLRMIASHGQSVKYIHDVVGVNSRLDTVQAAILNVKLKKLDYFISKRQKAASFYDQAFAHNPNIAIPERSKNSTHVFHQYTIRLLGTNREDFKKFLDSKGIPSMIYYPIPLHFQKAYSYLGYKEGSFPVAERLSKEVISIPMHTELTDEQLNYISSTILSYFK